MSDKQKKLLEKYLREDYISRLEDIGDQAISDFINLIIQLKQPNRWNVWIQNKMAENADQTEEEDLKSINYETLMNLHIYSLYSFIKFIAE